MPDTTVFCCCHRHHHCRRRRRLLPVKFGNEKRAITITLLTWIHSLLNCGVDGAKKGDNTRLNPSFNLWAKYYWKCLCHVGLGTLPIHSILHLYSLSPHLGWIQVLTENNRFFCHNPQIGPFFAVFFWAIWGESVFSGCECFPDPHCMSIPFQQSHCLPSSKIIDRLMGIIPFDAPLSWYFSLEYWKLIRFRQNMSLIPFEWINNSSAWWTLHEIHR